MPAYYGGTAQRVDPRFLIERLMRNGYSHMQAAAIVGNLQRESGFASNVMNKEEGAYGLMQWRGSRFEQLQQFAAKAGTSWTDPGTQIDFISHEMATTERKNAQGFLQARTIDEASAALKPVIRYGDKSLLDRQMFARNAFGAPPAYGPEATAAPPTSATQPRAGAQPTVSRETQARAYAPAADPAGQGSNARGLRGGLNSLGDMGAAFINKQRTGGAAGQPSGLAMIGQALAGVGGGAAAQSSGMAGAAPVSRSGLAAQITGAQDPRMEGWRGQEDKFQQGIRATPWFNEFKAKHGEEPNLFDPNYDYRAAWGAGARPTVRDPGDNMLHWPSQFKGAEHPNRYVGGVDTITGQSVPAASPPGAPAPPRFPGGAPMPRPRPMTGPGMPQGDPLLPNQTVAELGSLVDPMRYGYG